MWEDWAHIELKHVLAFYLVCSWEQSSNENYAISIHSIGIQVKIFQKCWPFRIKTILSVSMLLVQLKLTVHVKKKDKTKAYNFNV